MSIVRSKSYLVRCLLAIVTTIAAGSAAVVSACPFCAAVSQTFSEEISSMDVVLVATLDHAPAIPDSELADPNAELPRAKFKVKEVIKGQPWVDTEKPIEVLYFGEDKQGAMFLMMGADPPNLMWSTPLGINQRVYDYIKKAITLAEGPERLVFFQEYLEDEDDMLARDAYDEFAKTPYQGVKALKEHMHHDRLLEWIQETQIPASRRRLYYTMLGVCGTQQDAPLLERMMRSKERNVKAGLDAMIACYLILEPEKGLKVVEELFLQNENAEYADTYAAIMAIRFHGSEADAIPRKRLTQSLRYMLDRPELADLVIPDLARWKDWEVMPRLVALFKSADDKSSWVRVPVINYLRACPLPQATAYMDELKEIDPDAVKRAQTFFPFKPEEDSAKKPVNSPAESQENSEENETSGATTSAINSTGDSQIAETSREGIPRETSLDSDNLADAGAGPIEQPPVPTESDEPLDSTTVATAVVAANNSGEADISDTVSSETNNSDTNNSDTTTTVGNAETAAAPNQTNGQALDTPALANTPNLMLLLGVPLLFGIILLLLMRLILGLPQPAAA